MADSASSTTPSHFATLLASLTGVGKSTDSSWDTTALADDVATISYEQALRTHRRVRPSQSATEQLPNENGALPTNPSTTRPATSDRKTLKNASITIRLTADEQAQLHQRAAEAGLSTSAYLRSCIFEAESLRAQVKEALSQIRKTAAYESPAPTQKRFHLFARLMHRRKLEARS
jgi:hypothetical protein